MAVTQTVESSRADRALQNCAEASVVPHDLGTSEQDILDHITSRPAPKMIHLMAAVLEKRFAELLRDAVNAHADAELTAREHPGAEAEVKFKYYSQRLWALTPASRIIPGKREVSNGDDEKVHANSEIVKIFRRRLQLAESGNWSELDREFLR